MTDASTLVDGQIKFEKSYYDYLQSDWRRVASSQGLGVPSLETLAVDAPVIAIISHSRIVACCECGGAEYVWRNGPLVMICAACGNAAHRGLPRPVLLPTNLNEIEEVLMARVMPSTRNWYAHENVDALRQENIEHGMD